MQLLGAIPIRLEDDARPYRAIAGAVSMAPDS